MVKTAEKAEPKTTFRAKVTGRHAITLPAELCRQLGLAVGDTVELAIHGRQATLRKAIDEPEIPLIGLLRDYFKDRDDVQRFIEEERGRCDEQEE